MNPIINLVRIEIGELYLGTGERVVQIRDGAPADLADPICLAQMVRYMDEEAGIIRLKDGEPYGINFERVADFDEWLLAGDHLDTLLPERRGIVFLRPTRVDSNKRDVFEKIREDHLNKQIYVLVRNGERVYRIATPINIGDLAYPKLGEWAALVAEQERGNRYGGDSAEKKQFDYRKTIVLMQGLLDRSDVLQPFPGTVNLFDEETYRGVIVFMRDAEPNLTATIRPTYAEWKKGINAQIAQGSRVYLGPIPWGETRGFTSNGQRDEPHDRFPNYTGNYPSTLGQPGPGIYTVAEMRLNRDTEYRNGDPLIRFLPSQTVWPKDRYEYSHDRRTNVTFRLYRDDSFVLNYDALTSADLDHYINDRYERRHGRYLAMLPTLYEAARAKAAEEAREAESVKLLVGETGRGEAEILPCIAWWKVRNKWKRGLSTDDAKAYRMIKRAVVNGAWRHEREGA